MFLHSGRQFHEQIPDRKHRPAGSAFSAQKQITEDREIVVPANRLEARHAARAGPNQAFVHRQPGDDDVEKTADIEADDENENDPENEDCGN